MGKLNTAAGKISKLKTCKSYRPKAQTKKKCGRNKEPQ